jgi:hypothetical protein
VERGRKGNKDKEVKGRRRLPERFTRGMKV